MRQKILYLFEKVKEIETISAEAARKSHHAANEASAGLVASYSAAGDAEHARNTANLSIQKSRQIKKLSQELSKALDQETPEKTLPVCFVSVQFEDGSQKDFYFVENPIFLSGFNLISPASPLGASIMGKRVGEEFSYKSGEQNFKGKVVDIN